MDAILLARLQFAVTIMFHFLFPPITIGLSVLLVIIETFRWRTGDVGWRRASDFWLKILGINFVLGVASGIVMEFQFGTNWAGYSRFVGDIFGAPLAAEGVFSFFLESGFIGLLLFGRRRISSFVRWLSTLLVCVGAHISAFWILVANSWMQTPAGYRIANGRAELVDFWAAVFNPSMIQRYTHTVAAAWAAGAFLMAGISAWYFLHGRPSTVARRSLKLGTLGALVTSLLVFVTGDRQAREVAHSQEAKFAAQEGVYDTTAGAPLILFSLPPTKGGEPRGPELAVTRGLSWLAFGNFQTPVKGLREFPESDWPPVTATFLSFHNMVVLGNLMLLLSASGVYFWWRRRIESSRRWQRLMLWVGIPAPALAIQLGWATAEIGRQPWIVYGVMRTSEGVSKVVAAPEIAFSLILFSVIYLFLGALWIWLFRREVVHGPEEAPTIGALPAGVAPGEV